MADAVADYLRTVQTADSVRADAWDAVHSASDADAERALKALPVSDDVKARLWDLRQAPEAPAAKPQRSVFQRVTDAIPDVMATGYSLAGGGKSTPVGMLLSGLGGAAGEGYKQLAQHATEIPGAVADVTRNLFQYPGATMSGFARGAGEGAVASGLEGAKQSVFEGVGRKVIAPVMRSAGNAIYRSALKPSVAVRAEFPNAARTLVNEGVPITRSGAGTEQAAQALGAAAADTKATIAAAEAAGAKPVNMRPVAQSLERTRASVSDQAVRAADVKKVDAIRDALLKENPAPVPLTQAQAMKQAEQGRAIQAYKKQARGVPVNELRLSAREDIARGLREAIERRVPGIVDKNKRTQELIGALKAISAAEGRIANNNIIGMGDALSALTAFGGYQAAGTRGVAAGIIQEVLTRPEVASRLGIALDRAGKPVITAQALRAINEAVSQLSDRTEQ